MWTCAGARSVNSRRAAAAFSDVERELRGLENRREGAAMNWRGTERAQRREMLGRAVAFVPREAVTRIALVVLAHHPLARHLGEDRGRRDAEALAIATHDRGLRVGEACDLAPSNQHVGGLAAEPGERAARRQPGRPVDVELIDLGRLGDADRPRQRVGHYLIVKLSAPLGGK